MVQGGYYVTQILGNIIQNADLQRSRSKSRPQAFTNINKFPYQNNIVRKRGIIYLPVKMTRPSDANLANAGKLLLRYLGDK